MSHEQYRGFVGIVLALLGIGLATPPILQMIYGEAKANVVFQTSDQPDGHFLNCVVTNPPITAGFLYSCGVRRTAIQDLFISYTIKEEGTGKIIVSDISSDIIIGSGMASRRAHLPASPVGAVALIIGTLKAGDGMGIAKICNHDYTNVPVGHYVAIVGISVDGKRTVMERRFDVLTQYPYVKWVNPQAV